MCRFLQFCTILKSLFFASFCRIITASAYHIDASKIALMGWSAGGHLALLYAYKNPAQIDLVISEAGPTDFTGEDFENLPYGTKDPVLKLINYNTALLPDASPITHANSDSPHTIYLRGALDALVKKDQPIALVKKLLPDYENDEDETIEELLNSNALIDESNCAFFMFEGFAHGGFKNANDIYIENTQTDENRNLIFKYYNKIKNRLNIINNS